MKKRYYEYADDVQSGKVLACESIQLAVARFRSDLEQSKRRGARWVFDETEADRIIEFCEALEQFEEPFAGELLVLQPWQCFFVAQLYGWRDRKTGRRRFKKVLLFVGKKQGKTSLASALTLYEVLTKEGIEAYSLATKQEIANKTLRNLKAFIAHDQELSSMLRVYTFSIVHPGTLSTFKALSRDSDLDGLNPAFVIIDELAAQKNSSGYNALVSGMGARSEALVLVISTAGYGTTNPLIEEYEYARKILAGAIDDDSYLALLYELDKGDQWDDLSVMRKACPSIGVTVPLSYFDEQLRQARVIPKSAAEYKVKFCNLWQAAVDTWIPDRLWNRCAKNASKHRSELTEETLIGCPCIIACDFSTIWDYTAVTRYYWLAGIRKFAAFHRFWIPADQVDAKVHHENANIRKWIEDGRIVPTPGESIDYEYVYKDVDKYLERYRVLAITYDPAKSREFSSRYANRATIIPFPQKSSHLSPAAKSWEKAIVDELIIDEDPVVRWMVSCAINKANPDSGSYFITKSPIRKASKRIDGVITSIMAYAMLEQQVEILEKPRPTYFDLSQIKY